MSTCTYCGERRELELLEFWPEDRAFLFSTCCEELNEAAVEHAAHGERREVVAWFREQGIDVRQVYDGGFGALQLDYGLRLEQIEQRDAKQFVRDHHANHPAPPAGWRWGHAVYNGSDLIGVAMVGRAVARMIDPATTVEVNRDCVRRDVPKALTWNACSMLYGAACREAAKRGFTKVVTYTLESEDGGSLRASGFVPVAKVKGRGWGCKSRPRAEASSAQRADKIRWERQVA